jgi:hypothetical protein
VNGNRLYLRIRAWQNHLILRSKHYGEGGNPSGGHFLANPNNVFKASIPIKPTDI